MKNILLAVSLLVLSACASNPNKVEDLKDVTIQDKGSLSDSTSIGINNKDEAVVQSVQSVQSELNSIIWWNNTKEMEMNSEYGQLKTCRRDLSDPRLGGADRVKLPDLKKKWKESITERIGLVDQKLVVVKEQYLKEKITLEKEKGEYFEEMITLIKDSKEECEAVMGNARIKAGLPSTRQQGQVEITSDGKVSRVIQKHEHNLDDAFAFQEENKASKEEAADEKAHQREVELEKAKQPSSDQGYWPEY